MPSLLTFPEFVQLLDDGLVSLTALTLIAEPKCRKRTSNVRISQLILSLYLMTQCQLKLHHSVASLVSALECIEIYQKGSFGSNRTLDTEVDRRFNIDLPVKTVLTRIYVFTNLCCSNCCRFHNYCVISKYFSL